MTAKRVILIHHRPQLNSSFTSESSVGHRSTQQQHKLSTQKGIRFPKMYIQKEKRKEKINIFFVFFLRHCVENFLFHRLLLLLLLLLLLFLVFHFFDGIYHFIDGQLDFLDRHFMIIFDGHITVT